jgi:hypothetical protein
VPCNSEIEDFLLSHLVATDDISEEFIISLKQLKLQKQDGDCIEVFSEPIIIENLLTEKELYDILKPLLDDSAMDYVRELHKLKFCK